MPWYHSTWKIILIGFVAVLAVFVGSVGFLTFKYWRQIKSGGYADLAKELAGKGFSTSVGGVNSTVPVVDRQQVENTDNPYLGRPTAPTVIVEFVDFKCPNSVTAGPIMRQILNKYGYKIKYIIRYFPAEVIRPGSNQLALIMRCAEKQGKFWTAQDWVFNNQDQFPAGEIAAADLANFAGAMSLDSAKLSACLANPATADKVQADYLDGIRFGVRGTPTWFVNGVKIEGVVPYDRWQNYLDNLK